MLFQIGGEELGSRHCCGIGARLGDVAKRQAAVCRGIAHRRKANFGIEGAISSLGKARFDNLGEMFAEEVRRLFIKRDQTLNRRDRIGEILGRRCFWGNDRVVLFKFVHLIVPRQGHLSFGGALRSPTLWGFIP